MIVFISYILDSRATIFIETVTDFPAPSFDDGFPECDSSVTYCQNEDDSDNEDENDLNTTEETPPIPTGKALNDLLHTAAYV